MKQLLVTCRRRDRHPPPPAGLLDHQAGGGRSLPAHAGEARCRQSLFSLAC